MSGPDKEEIAEQTACPFCSSIGGCEHLLLLLDLTFRTAEGGDLLDAFRDRWSRISDRAEGDFDELGVFDGQLREVEALADASLEYVFEGGPGNSCDYAMYFCSSRERVVAAVKKFEADLAKYEYIEGDHCPFCQAFNSPAAGEACEHHVGWQWDGAILDLDIDLLNLQWAWQRACDEVQSKSAGAEFGRLVAGSLGSLDQRQTLIDLVDGEADFRDLLEAVGIRAGGRWQTKGMLGGSGHNLYVVERQHVEDATTFYETLWQQAQKSEAGALAESLDSTFDEIKIVGKQKRAVLVIVTKWPDGTMAFKFGDALKMALGATGDDVKLVQMGPERIFRAETNVSEAEFREAIKRRDVSCSGRVLFVEM
ncbi:MAG: hypothetical protein RIR77_37 [Planctomycetota bacterium]|jgi:hypothetical protein